MKTNNKINILLGSIILLGLILRFTAVLKYGDFWDDEMFNFIYSQKAWPQGLIYWLWETNPPLHMLILKIWFVLFPATEFFARLPGVIAGCLSIFFIFKLGKEIFNEKIGLLAAFYLAIHPYNIFWSASARIYSFLMLFTILSTLILYKQFFREDASKRLKISGAIINGLLVFSHLSAIFVLAGQFFTLALFKGKKAVSNWIKCNLIPFIMGAGWIIMSLYIKKDNNVDKSWFLNLAQSFQDSINPLLNIFAGQFWTLPGLMLLILAAAIILYNIYKTRSIGLLFLAALITVPLVLSAGLGVWHIKFFVTILPLFVLTIAYSLSTIVRDIFSVLLIASICLLGLYNLQNTLPLTSWRQTEALFKNYETNDKFVFVYNNYILKTQVERYLNKDIFRNSKTIILYKNMSWDDMVVKKNYIPLQLSDEEKNAWYNENLMDSYSTVALLQNEFPSMTKLDDLFIQHGWILKQQPVRAPIAGTYKLYIYIKI